MAFIDEQQCIVRQVIEQRRRRFARKTARKMPRIIFNAVAIADLLDHFQIEHGALIQPLRFDQLALLSSSLCHHCSSFSMLCIACSRVGASIT